MPDIGPGHSVRWCSGNEFLGMDHRYIARCKGNRSALGDTGPGHRDQGCTARPVCRVYRSGSRFLRSDRFFDGIGWADRYRRRIFRCLCTESWRRNGHIVHLGRTCLDRSAHHRTDQTGKHRCDRLDPQGNLPGNKKTRYIGLCRIGNPKCKEDDSLVTPGRGRIDPKRRNLSVILGVWSLLHSCLLWLILLMSSRGWQARCVLRRYRPFHSVRVLIRFRPRCCLHLRHRNCYRVRRRHLGILRRPRRLEQELLRECLVRREGR